MASGQPISYVVLPLLVIIVTFIALLIVFRRRGQRLARAAGENGAWPPGRPAPVIVVRANRPGVSTTRHPVHGRSTPLPEEGLNELGEAPPPYDGKRERADRTSMEMRDLEAGPERLPDYPAQPPPAMTRV